jgi:hypothetical protein
LEWIKLPIFFLSFLWWRSMCIPFWCQKGIRVVTHSHILAINETNICGICKICMNQSQRVSLSIHDSILKWDNDKASFLCFCCWCIPVVTSDYIHYVYIYILSPRFYWGISPCIIGLYGSLASPSLLGSSCSSKRRSFDWEARLGDSWNPQRTRNFYGCESQR